MMPLLFLILALAFALVGCAQEEPIQQGEELAQEEIEQLLADAAAATAEIDTCKFDANMTMTIKAIGGEQALGVTLTTDMTCAVDNANREMRMAMDATQEVPGEAKVKMATEFYVVGDWTYAKVKVLDILEQWGKMRLSEDVWDRLDMVSGQIELLTAPLEVNFFGSEDVNGTACYVLQLMPTAEALSDWLSQQGLSGIEKIEWLEVNLEEIFKEWSHKCWIAKGSSLLTKLEANMLLEMPPEYVGASEGDFEKETIEIDLVMRVYGHNEPVSIELPEEALEAPEMDIN